MLASAWRETTAGFSKDDGTDALIIQYSMSIATEAAYMVHSVLHHPPWLSTAKNTATCRQPSKNEIWLWKFLKDALFLQPVMEQRGMTFLWWFKCHSFSLLPSLWYLDDFGVGGNLLYQNTAFDSKYFPKASCCILKGPQNMFPHTTSPPLPPMKSFLDPLTYISEVKLATRST